MHDTSLTRLVALETRPKGLVAHFISSINLGDAVHHAIMQHSFPHKVII